MIKKINHIAIIVPDIDSSLAFWRDTLGLPLARVEEVRKLAARADGSGAVLVAGSRAVADSIIQARQSRRLIGRLFHFSLRTLGLAPIRDTQCGFKLYRADLAALIVRIAREDRFAFDVEHLLIARRFGAIQEVGIAWEHRDGGTVRPVRDGLKMLARSLVIRIRTPRVIAASHVEPKPAGAEIVVKWAGNQPRPAAAARGAAK